MPQLRVLSRPDWSKTHTVHVPMLSMKAIPRTGESLVLPVGDGLKLYRVEAVVHHPAAPFDAMLYCVFDSDQVPDFT
jgi:hypothetical protein